MSRKSHHKKHHKCKNTSKNSPKNDSSTSYSNTPKSKELNQLTDIPLHSPPEEESPIGSTSSTPSLTPSSTYQRSDRSDTSPSSTFFLTNSSHEQQNSISSTTVSVYPNSFKEEATHSTYQNSKEKDDENNCSITIVDSTSSSTFIAATDTSHRHKERNCTLTVFFSLVASIPLSVLIRRYTPSTGQFVFGAAKSYEEGYALGYHSVNLTDPSVYQLLLLKRHSPYNSPAEVDFRQTSVHLSVSALFASLSGFITSAGLTKAFFSKLQADATEEKSIVKMTRRQLTVFLAIATALIVSYSAGGGFDYIGHQSPHFFQEGVHYGNSTYGFFDGNNALCPFFNLSNCPGPIYRTAINDALDQLANTNLLTNTRDGLFFLAHFVTYAFSGPLLGGALKLGEWSWKKFTTVWRDSKEKDHLLSKKEDTSETENPIRILKDNSDCWESIKSCFYRTFGY